MQIRHAIGEQEYKRMSTAELRSSFLQENPAIPGTIKLLYWETDRAVLGGAVPTAGALKLSSDKHLASDYFCERRELGIFTLAGEGGVTVDKEHFSMTAHDGLYVGRGSREIAFASNDAANPARFLLVSYPAHKEYPTQFIPRGEVNRIELGSHATANKRTIFQYIHEGGARSCQLVMGFTRLETGSVWNTMPPHTHTRRSEIYCYFEVPQSAAVVHLMGSKEETRHLMVHNQDIVLSPIWSIHSGCGTQAYSFVWAMGGENQRFTDMDAIDISDLR